MKKKIVLLLAFACMLVLLVCNRYRLKYPEYYNLDTFKGIEVYVWQTEEGEYRCGALSGTNIGKEFEEISNLAANSATIREMKTILSSYDVGKDGIIIIPITITSSNYEIVSKDFTKINEVFWEK